MSKLEGRALAKRVGALADHFQQEAAREISRYQQTGAPDACLRAQAMAETRDHLLAALRLGRAIPQAGTS